MKNRVLIVTGPTATGKTHLAVELARIFHGMIISADSRQVYRRMDLGTGKDLGEYSAGGARVPYRLIDICEPGEPFSLFDYLPLAHQAIREAEELGYLPIIAGGTPLYIQALLDGYQLEGPPTDPEFAKLQEGRSDEDLLTELEKIASPDFFQRVDKTQRRRIIRGLEIARALAAGCEPKKFPALNLRTLMLAPLFPRAVVHQRIEARLDQRLQQGMIEEIQALLDSGISFQRLEWFGLEYRFVGRYLHGDLSYQEMRDMLLAHIRQFCKRQDIWFRKFQREGKELNWIPEGNLEQATTMVQNWLDSVTRD